MLGYEVMRPDAYALEEALRQKEKNGGEVVVITAGPARASSFARKLSPREPIAIPSRRRSLRYP